MSVPGEKRIVFMCPGLSLLRVTCHCYCRGLHAHFSKWEDIGWGLFSWKSPLSTPKPLHFIFPVIKHVQRHPRFSQLHRIWYTPPTCQLLPTCLYRAGEWSLKAGLCAGHPGNGICKGAGKPRRSWEVSLFSVRCAYLCRTAQEGGTGPDVWPALYAEAEAFI